MRRDSLILILSMMLVACGAPKLPHTPLPSHEDNDFIPKAGPTHVIPSRLLDIGYAPTPRLTRRGAKLFYTTRNGYFYLVDLLTLTDRNRIRLNDGQNSPVALRAPLLFSAAETAGDGLTVYNLQQGKIIKKLPLKDARAAVLLSGDRLIHASLDGTLSALHLPDLEKQWSVLIDQPVHADMRAAEGQLYVVTSQGRVRSYREQDGVLNWSLDVDDAFYARPAYHDGKLFCAAYSGNVYVCDARTGALLTRIPGRVPVYTDPLTDNERLYIPHADGTLAAYSLSTLHKAWRVELHAPFGAPLLVTEGALYSGQLSRRLFIINTATGAIYQEQKLKGRPLSQPVLFNGNLYMCTSPGQIEEFTAHE